MKFTALKITEGDSFLLETEHNSILVDTGEDNTECRDQLRLEKIDHLDAVIITHYDQDHVNGLIELIKSSIKIDEIWLPDNFGRIEKSIKENTSKLLNSLKEVEFSTENVYELKKIESEIALLPTFLSKESNELVEIIMLYKPILTKKHLILIESIINECKKKSLKIRWLKYTGVYKEINITQRIIGLNCMENTNIISYTDDLEVLYFLSRINHESLVLKYSDDNFPDILFTGDTGFEFIDSKSKIKLKPRSIMTAPHHGSATKEIEKGYQIVEGEDLIYVRSESYKVKKVSKKFKSQYEKYCTKCKNGGTLDKVFLEYSGDWTSNNRKCTCV